MRLLQTRPILLQPVGACRQSLLLLCSFFLASFLQVPEYAFASTAETNAGPVSVGEKPRTDKSGERIRVLVLSPVASGVEKTVVDAVSNVIAVQLGMMENLEVIHGLEIQRMLELEAQRANIGCTETSCLGDIAGAFGSELVVFGDIGRLGELYVLTLNLFDTAKAKSMGRVFVRTKNVEDFPDLLAVNLPELMKGVIPLPARPDEDNVANVQPATAAEPELRPATALSSVSDSENINDDNNQAVEPPTTTDWGALGVGLVVVGATGMLAGTLPWVTHEIAVLNAAGAIEASDRAAYDEWKEVAAGAGFFQQYALDALGVAVGATALGGGLLMWGGHMIFSADENME